MGTVCIHEGSICQEGCVIFHFGRRCRWLRFDDAFINIHERCHSLAALVGDRARGLRQHSAASWRAAILGLRQVPQSGHAPGNGCDCSIQCCQAPAVTYIDYDQSACLLTQTLAIPCLLPRRMVLTCARDLDSGLSCRMQCQKHPCSGPLVACKGIGGVSLWESLGCRASTLLIAHHLFCASFRCSAGRPGGGGAATLLRRPSACSRSGIPA